MVAHGELPKDEILGWMKKGLTNQQILVLLDAHPWHLKPTSQAISLIRSRNKMPPIRATYGEVFPWTVKDADQRKFVAAMLRLLARQRRGETLPMREKNSLEGWLGQLEKPPQVVTYVENDPTGQGWYYLPREPWDTDIIRANPHGPTRSDTKSSQESITTQ